MSCYTKKNIMKQFTAQFFEFMSFVKENSNKDKVIYAFYTRCNILKKVNVKLFIKTWHDNITTIYYNHIMNDNISFFLNKDYNSDINKTGNTNIDFNKYINHMKISYNTFSELFKQRIVTYIKNLTSLSYDYFK